MIRINTFRAARAMAAKIVHARREPWWLVWLLAILVSATLGAFSQAAQAEMAPEALSIRTIPSGYVAAGPSFDLSCGDATNQPECDRLVVAQYNDSGFVTRTNTTSPLGGHIMGTAFQPDGRVIVVLHQGKHTSSSQTWWLRRFLPDGSADPSFGSSSGTQPLSYGADQTMSLIATDHAGRVVVSNTQGGGDVVARFRPDGTLDTSFSGGDGGAPPGFSVYYEASQYDPVTSAIAIAPNDKIILGGTDQAGNGFALKRLTTGGANDEAFGPAPFHVVYTRYPEFGSMLGENIRALGVQSDGSIVAAGAMDYRGTGGAVAKYTSTGTLDSTFGGGSPVLIAGFKPAAIALGANARWIIAGSTSGNSSAIRVARYNADGSPDTTFGGNGTATNAYPPGQGATSPAYTYATTVGVDSSDRAVAAGSFNYNCPNDSSGAYHFVEDFAVVRFTSTGSVDSSFGDSGRVPQTVSEGCAPPPGSAPPAPTPIAPDAGARLDYGEVTFAWSDVAGARSYTLVIDGHIVRSGLGSTSVTLSGLGAGRHDWSVRASTAAGEGGSSPRGFTLRPRLVALGDSVTAGFGYDISGTEVAGTPLSGEMKACMDNPHSAACEDARLAYPAVYGARHGVQSAARLDDAVSGSSPADWVGGGLRAQLDEIVNDDPDMTVLTLGANPLLKFFASDFSVYGGWSCSFSASCIQAKIADEEVVPRLEYLYRRLLLASHNHVVVMAYHDTVPVTLAYSEIGALMNALNGAVATAVQTVQQDPGVGNRLRLVYPPSFVDHRCAAAEPWVLSHDSCIHPSRAGHVQFAQAIDDSDTAIAAGIGPLEITPPSSDQATGTLSGADLALIATFNEAGIVHAVVSRVASEFRTRTAGTSPAGSVLGEQTIRIGGSGTTQLHVTLPDDAHNALENDRKRGPVTLRVDLRGVNAAGMSTFATFTITVPATPTPPGQATTPPSGALAVVNALGSLPPPSPALGSTISNLSISPRGFRAARRGPTTARLGGATVRYRLIGPAATVRFWIEKPVRGIRRGRSCVAAAAHSRRHARGCTRYVSLPGGWARRSVTGSNSFIFTGRPSGHSLRRGAYRLVAGIGASRGAATRAAFRITG